MTMTDRPGLVWNDDGTELRVGDVTYLCRSLPRPIVSTGDRFQLLKARAQVEHYVELLTSRQPRTMIELGVFHGGSAALATQLVDLERLVTIELRDTPNPALMAFRRDRALESTVHCHWGVSQDDTDRLHAIADAEFGDAHVDLVVDDASHRLAETRAGFNALFPRVRPGGCFVIEDWGWAHTPFSFDYDLGINAIRPLSLLVFEATLAAAHSPGVIERVEVVGRDWAAITRGPAQLPFRGFDLADHIGAVAHDLLAAHRADTV